MRRGNLLGDAAPHAEVIHGPLACMVSLNDMCDRLKGSTPTIRPSWRRLISLDGSCRYRLGDFCHRARRTRFHLSAVPEYITKNIVENDRAPTRQNRF